ncbi:MAG TPA: hypothetical protein VH188_05605 [Chthoniobacterales bacterium]|jgi:hypothetical protein|nr:hypothetical protein [Chthoniobacterales bacterium]
MSINSYRLAAVTLIALTAIGLFPRRADAFAYNVNLIQNPNGDLDTGSTDGSHVAVTNWATSSAFTVIKWVAGGGYPINTDPGPSDRGANFFAGGNGAAVSTATQQIDLSANAGDINSGNVVYNLTGYFGGFSSDNDNATLTATFFNISNTILGAVTTGDVTASDRTNATGLLQRTASGIIPVNATKVVLTLTMTRLNGSSNDGYADSLDFRCTLGGASTTNSSFVQNGTTVSSATGSWSDSTRWSTGQVPNNANGVFYNATINALTLSGQLSNENRTITRHFGAVRLDTTVTISNLTLVDAGLTDGGPTGSDHEHDLTVLGTTTDQSVQNLADNPGFNIETHNAQATVSLGNFTNFSGGTLSGTKIRLFAGGPAATLQFKGADITTLNAGVNLIGSNTHIIDENGNNGLRHLATIGPSGFLSTSASDFVNAGNLTVNGSLGISDSGLDSSFTVAGSLTNFDSGTRTLTGGSFGVQRFLGTPATKVILRFPNADIVNNASSISITGPASQILDQNGNDGLRNFAHNLAGGVLFFTDHNFTTAGAFTNDGDLRLDAQSQATTFTVSGSLTNFDGATRTLTGGSFEVFGTSFNSSMATLKFQGADIVHNASSITIGAPAAIMDLSNNDGLRNFVDNKSTGSFSLVGAAFTAPSDFTNAGTVSLSNFDPSQVFTVAGGHSYIQTGGDTSLFDSILTAANVLIQGGILHRGGTINGNVNVTRGTIAPTSGGGGGTVNLGGLIIVVPGSTDIPGPDTMTINGNLNLGADAHLSLVIRNNTAGEFDTMNVSGSANFGGTLDVSFVNGFQPAPNDSFTVLTAGPNITGAFINAANGARFPTTDGRGSFIATYSDNHLVLSNFQTKPPDQLLNISTRMRVLTGNNVLIVGFIITGTDPKKVIIRGIGPSLKNIGLQGALADTTLELHTGGTPITNDNWKIDDQTGQSQEAAIRATTVPPSDDLESALVVTLNPGTYTAILAGKNQTTGIGVVEVYDLDPAANSKMANISTRGLVDTGDNAMFGGFAVGGNGGGAAKVIIRGLGPSLGIDGALADPILELHDANGVIATNDNWKDSQKSDVEASTIPPPNDGESAIVRTLVPGLYTVILRGVNNGTGIGLIEVYDLD